MTRKPRSKKQYLKNTVDARLWINEFLIDNPQYTNDKENIQDWLNKALLGGWHLGFYDGQMRALDKLERSFKVMKYDTDYD